MGNRGDIKVRIQERDVTKLMASMNNFPKRLQGILKDMFRVWGYETEARLQTNYPREENKHQKRLESDYWLRIVPDHVAEGWKAHLFGTAAGRFGFSVKNKYSTLHEQARAVIGALEYGSKGGVVITPKIAESLTFKNLVKVTPKRKLRRYSFVHVMRVKQSPMRAKHPVQKEATALKKRIAYSLSRLDINKAFI